LDNDYENAKPTTAELEGIASIINEHYANVAKENIVGHLEVNPSTVCPSNLFLGENGWKKELLELLK
jgi:N-acetyl-anhydromuramyl-L-alanine amidase AmpD